MTILLNMIRKKVYELGIDEIVTNSNEEEIKEKDLQGTTVNFPQIIRLVLTDIKERHKKLNWQRFSRRIIEHGFSIMEYEYGQTVEEIRQLKTKLRYAKRSRIRNYTMDTRVCVDGTNKMSRKSIKLRKTIFAAINDMAFTLGLETSSLIRLCVYHSLVTSRELPEEIIDVSKEEIESFVYDLEETKSILEDFGEGEEKWKDNIKKIEKRSKAMINRLKYEEVELEEDDE